MTHPIDSVRWVHRSELRANDYNPNHVATPELQLLKTSLLEDGWTQPIVATPAGEIVDGFHRWTLAGTPELETRDKGYVPVVELQRDEAHRIMSTIRHNRARGVHGVIKMSDIVGRLHDDLELDAKEIGRLLGMEAEEVTRLYENSSMATVGSGDGFSKGWVPE